MRFTSTSQIHDNHGFGYVWINTIIFIHFSFQLSLVSEFKWWDILNNLYNHFVYNWMLKSETNDDV